MSYENSGSSLFQKIAFHVLTRPVNLALYWLSWHHLCSLCKYGRLYRNVPVLAVCLLWWICAIGYGLWLWRRYKKGRCPAVFHKLLSQERGLALSATGDEEEPALTGMAPSDEPGGTKAIGLAGRAGARGQGIERISEGSVKWYVKRRHFCQFFLKEKRVALLDLRELTREERDFLDVKLSAISFLGKGVWRAAAGIFLAAVTLYGGRLVAESAVPYQGKLAWYLDDLRDKRTCTLKHDNIYEWGIEGILEDVGEKVDLPKTLCLATSFNLHFAPDGEIVTLDTMLYGFDEKGDFVDSYLISYNRAHSGKMTIYLHGASSASYEESRALAPLVEGVGVMPLRETVEEWPGEECYGILYYGSREWYSSEGIRLLDSNGDWQLPPRGQAFFSGYSISVFCPENEALVPVRYLCSQGLKFAADS